MAVPIAVFLAGTMGKALIKRVGRTAAEKIAKNPKKRADFVKAREKEQMAKSKKRMDTMRKAQKDAMRKDKPASSYSGSTRNTGGAGKGDKPLKAVDEMMKKNMSRMKNGGKIYLSPGVKEAVKMGKRIGKKVPKKAGKKMSYPVFGKPKLSAEVGKMTSKILRKGPTTKKTNETPKKKYKKMMGGGKVMKYSMGGKIDGVALRGRTRAQRSR